MYVIDGIFLAKRITGIQRYAIEITKELDKIVEKGTIKIVVPEYCDNTLDLENIELIRYGKRKPRVWEQIDLVKYLKSEKADGIYFENTIPLLYKKGIVVVHDISLKANPRLFCNSINNICSLIWRRFLYRQIFKSSMRVVTVSKFSKSEIIKYYNVESNRISVISNAWQHMVSVPFDDSILKKYNLSVREYIFSLATIAPNKNIRWIISAAKNHPDDIFVIAGGGNVRKVINDEYENLKNVICLGYISDGEAKTLMSGCKAFLFPTFYEGFGIPPLEALACGALAIILSDTPCMHEIYGRFANYIDPYDYESDYRISKTLSESDRKEILDKYKWMESSKQFYDLMFG